MIQSELTLPTGKRVVIDERLANAIAELPSTGMPRAAFIGQCMPEATPNAAADVCRHLRQARLIRMKSSSGITFVLPYDSQENVNRIPLPVAAPAVSMLSSILPLVIRIQSLSPDDEPAFGRRIALTMERELIEELEGAVLSSGVSPQDARAAIGLAYRAVMTRILQVRPEFLMTPLVRMGGNIPRGLSLSVRIIETIKRYGSPGMTVTELRTKLDKPHQLSATMHELQSEGLIHAAEGPLTNGTGRPPVLYFVTERPQMRDVSPGCCEPMGGSDRAAPAKRSNYHVMVTGARSHIRNCLQRIFWS